MKKGPRRGNTKRSCHRLPTKQFDEMCPAVAEGPVLGELFFQPRSHYADGRALSGRTLRELRWALRLGTSRIRHTKGSSHCAVEHGATFGVALNVMDRCITRAVRTIPIERLYCVFIQYWGLACIRHSYRLKAFIRPCGGRHSLRVAAAVRSRLDMRRYRQNCPAADGLLARSSTC